MTRFQSQLDGVGMERHKNSDLGQGWTVALSLSEQPGGRAVGGVQGVGRLQVRTPLLEECRKQLKR